jgi:DNA invertase Pin-like site-specific DNA recombinase
VKIGEKMVKDDTRKKQRTVSYLRVSTTQQDTEKNKTDVRAYANLKDLGRVEFIEETSSGKKPWKERKIKQVIDDLQEGDRLILPELSRLGRTTFEVMEILSIAKEKGIHIYDIKNGWELNGSLQSEVMAFAFSIAARIERDMLIQRTAEGRRAAMARGVKFGRPKGPGKSKLDPYKEEIIALLKTGSRQNYIARKYKVTPATVNNWLKKNEISVKEVY